MSLVRFRPEAPLGESEKLKNVERQATEPVRWPPIDRGVSGGRQMRISCNLLIIYASLAQWKEQEISNLLVEGSNPSGCARLDD